MKILVLTERFLPEISAPCFRIHDHAKVWIELGHEVTVVTCAPNFPRGKLFHRYKNRLYQEEWYEGIRVVRLWSYLAPNEGVFRRTLDYVSFMTSAAALCNRFPDFDVVLATSGPFFTAIAGFLVSMRRRRPWVFEIRDLWPASVEAVGAVRGWPVRMVEKLELYLYRRAHRIISLTHSFKRDLERRHIASDKIDVITNGVDADQFNPSRISPDARSALGVPPDVFLAGYIGTTGLAHGLDTIIDAAQRCKAFNHIRFLIMGEGADRKRLESYAAGLGLSNILFSDFVPHSQMPSFLDALDLSVVHLKPQPLFKTVIPSKIFESMAMGTPILMAVEGESAQIVKAAGCGVCIPPGNAQAMAEAIVHLAGDREQLTAMRNRGIHIVQRDYSRRENAIKCIESFELAIESYRRVGRPIRLHQKATVPFKSSPEVLYREASDRRKAA